MLFKHLPMYLRMFHSRCSVFNGVLVTATPLSVLFEVLEFTEAKPEEHTAELEVSDAAAKDKKDKEAPESAESACSYYPS